MINLAIWDTLKGFFLGIYDKFNDFLANTLDIDGKLIGLYQEFIVPLPEIIKIVGIDFIITVIIIS